MNNVTTLDRQAIYKRALTKTVESYRNPSITRDNSAYLHQSPVDWIEREFFIPELNGPMMLYPYQKAALNEALRKDDGGKFVYDLVVWGDIKKSAKSSIAGAIVLYRALQKEWGSFKIIANDLNQANSRVFFYITRAIELNSRLKVRASIKNYKITLDNHTIIEAIPVDPDGEAGAGDDMLEYTELHAFKSKAALKLWTETTLSPLKYGYSQRWADTYAGHEGESPILEPIYQQVVKPENLLDLGIPGLEAYAHGRIFALWNTLPKLPWQTPEYYASEATVLTPNEFLRIHRNQWVSSTTTFVPTEWWTACATANVPPLDRYNEIVVGIDAAVTNDCFGIVAVSRDGDKVIKRFSRKWTPPKGGKLEYSNPDDKFDVEYPEGVLRWLANTYNVIAFGYDPYQLHHLCTSLIHDNVGMFEEIKQGAPRLEADKQLYDVIRDKRIIHDDDPDLTQHIKNANQQVDPQSRQLRIVHRTDALKIDLAVSLSMAVYMAYRYLPE